MRQVPSFWVHKKALPYLFSVIQIYLNFYCADNQFIVALPENSQII